MLAKIIRETFQQAMGKTLDLIRLSDIGERQLRQLIISVKNEWNASLIDLFEELQTIGLIQQCDCLKALLVAKDSQAVDTEEMRKLYEKKKYCDQCSGSGYRDTFEVEKEAEIEEENKEEKS